MNFLPHEKQILEYQKTITQFKNKQDSLFSASDLQRLEKRLEKLKKQVYSSLTPWERVQICRHPLRPRSIDYITNICSKFCELCGDRLFREDPSVIGGFAKIGEEKCVIIGQEKGKDTESRLKHNFGMLHPEGFRKALRLAKLGEKFSLPVIFLLDTPGAYPGLSAEERGQGWAIAENLRELSSLATPIIVLIIGEGCSGGALGMGIGDVIGMLEHSYYSVISPEGCASILWKDPKKNSTAAAMLKMHAEDLLAFEIIDIIIKEPLGGAHHDKEAMFKSVISFILNQIEYLKQFSLEDLIERRYKKIRCIGQYEVTSKDSIKE